jgi:hypothetical protein
MRLEEPNPQFTFKPQADRRLRVPEPLPVKLIAVADMRIESAAGMERQGVRRAAHAAALAVL